MRSNLRWVSSFWWRQWEIPAASHSHNTMVQSLFHNIKHRIRLQIMELHRLAGSKMNQIDLMFFCHIGNEF